MKVDNIFIREIKNEFIEESSKYLEQAKYYFLKFDKNRTDTIIIEHLFIIINNLRDSSQAVGFGMIWFALIFFWVEGWLQSRAHSHPRMVG